MVPSRIELLILALLAPRLNQLGQGTYLLKAQVNVDDALIDRATAIKTTTTVFNSSIKVEGALVTNQKASGRCWLFASRKELHLHMMHKLSVKEFQCNYFLNRFAENIANENLNDVESRLNQFLWTDPTSDGGQYYMFINIGEKYGMIPYDLYPDAFSATSSRRVNFLILTKLREFAEQLNAISQLLLPKYHMELIHSMQQKNHRLLVLFLGEPLAKNAELSWDYKDKDDNVLGVDVSSWVSLLNDPRNTYDSVIQIEKLGNVVGAKKREIMNQSLFSYDLIGFETNQGKASRIKYMQSLMIHAMTLTAIHLDQNGNPVRWREENSWGKDSGQNGYYAMDQQYFKDYVYQIVVNDAQLLQRHQDVLKKSTPIVLPPWDPMDALATFKNEVEVVSIEHER
ncbi:peptidase C1B, bleomycin hydrolase [Metschnikowia bicuspidata]|uniref:Cysteine proteinase 1, mitochondrial n=1 Tax=Metschnikowia bicuspidata TaxID=27322 RepID=A0A4P9ZI13_9ASCO|nr:peptidase C1B, bleomycin hydrolase [Metschnikowia bicuspidata]